MCLTVNTDIQGEYKESRMQCQWDEIEVRSVFGGSRCVCQFQPKYYSGGKNEMPSVAVADPDRQKLLVLAE